MRSIFVCVSTYNVECEQVSPLSTPHYTSVQLYALRPGQVLLILTSEVYFVVFFERYNIFRPLMMEVSGTRL